MQLHYFQFNSPKRRMTNYTVLFFSNCDPKCLLQGAETSKLPKVVRRGRKRCFGVKLEKGSPKSLLHQWNHLLHHCNKALFAPVQQAFGPHTPKHLLHPLLTIRAISRFWVPIASTRGRNSGISNAIIIRRAVLGSSRGPCYQRDLPM